jgi:hypothetical protein
MKSAFLLTAMLSGLCAGAMASPISNMTRNRTTPVIQPDLHFNTGSLEKVSVDETLLDEDQAELVTTAIEFEQAIAPQQLALDGNQPSGPRGVPEPPPGELIVIGLSLLGIIAIWRWAHRYRRRARRRHVVRMREITAVR